MSVSLDAMSPFARGLVDRLGLQPHPEGGWYVRDWQSPISDSSGARPLASLIYFLLAAGDASAWHKVDADEIWLWHGPAPVTVETAGTGDSPSSNRTRTVLGAGIASASVAGNINDSDTIRRNNLDGNNLDGNDLDNTTKNLGESADPVHTATDPTHSIATAPTGHLVIPAGVWQRTIPSDGDALVSCVVSPGFEFSGFTLTDDPQTTDLPQS